MSFSRGSGLSSLLDGIPGKADMPKIEKFPGRSMNKCGRFLEIPFLKKLGILNMGFITFFLD